MSLDLLCIIMPGAFYNRFLFMKPKINTKRNYVSVYVFSSFIIIIRITLLFNVIQSEHTVLLEEFLKKLPTLEDLIGIIYDFIELYLKHCRPDDS